MSQIIRVKTKQKSCYSSHIRIALMSYQNGQAHTKQAVYVSYYIDVIELNKLSLLVCSPYIVSGFFFEHWIVIKIELGTINYKEVK